MISRLYTTCSIPAVKIPRISNHTLNDRDWWRFGEPIYGSSISKEAEEKGFSGRRFPCEVFLRVVLEARSTATNTPHTLVLRL